MNKTLNFKMNPNPPEQMDACVEDAQGITDQPVAMRNGFCWDQADIMI